jgi:exonuclease VII large subunit
MGPQATLQTGFAIVRDDDDNPFTSREAAMNHTSFQVQFRDGMVSVQNLESVEENDQ